MSDDSSVLPLARPRNESPPQRFRQRLAERARLSADDADALASAVLCALEIRVLGDDLATVETVPLKAAELMQRCALHRRADVAAAATEPILKRVAEDLNKPPAEVEQLIRHVFATLREELTEPEADDLSRHLPNEVLPLWYHTH